jgi:hypothetical protein
MKGMNFSNCGVNAVLTMQFFDSADEIERLQRQSYQSKLQRTGRQQKAQSSKLKLVLDLNLYKRNNETPATLPPTFAKIAFD